MIIVNYFTEGIERNYIDRTLKKKCISNNVNNS